NPEPLGIQHHDLARRWGGGKGQLAVSPEGEVVRRHADRDTGLDLARRAVKEEDLVGVLRRDDYEIASLPCQSREASCH
ncbi:MAG: hypothetical protein HY766_10960, partial [candidate division NC10 bacterium]|nr:hypothetical protein [candidate division NC10 bacterium]